MADPRGGRPRPLLPAQEALHGPTPSSSAGSAPRRARGVAAERARGRAAARRDAAAGAGPDRGGVRGRDARELPGAASAAALLGGVERARDPRGRRLDGLRRARRSAHGQELLHGMRSDSEVRLEDGLLGFHSGPTARSRASAATGRRPPRSRVEQSNSSVVFGEELILKAFRRVGPGRTPSWSLLRFLSARGFPNIAPLGGGRLRVSADPRREPPRHPAADHGGAHDGWSSCSTSWAAIRRRCSAACGCSARPGSPAPRARLRHLRPGVSPRRAEHGVAVTAHRDRRRARSSACSSSFRGRRDARADRGAQPARARAPPAAPPTSPPAAR